MADVVQLHTHTLLPIPVERVLEGALERHADKPFQRLTVVAVHEDGEEYFASSTSDCGAILWDMDRFRHQSMKNADHD